VNLGQWIGLIVLAISLYVLYQIRQVILLVFGAIVLATALNQLARYFQRLGIRRGFAVVLSVCLFVTLVIVFLWLLVPPFMTQFQELTERVPKGIEHLKILLDGLVTRVPKQLAPYVLDLDNLSQQAQPLVNQVLRNSLTFFSSSLSAVLNLLLVLVLTGMLLADPQSYRRVFIRIFPSFYRRRVDFILAQCEVGLIKWLIGTLISMSVVALMSAIGLWILQVEPVLALGVLAGFLNLIPNLGPTISVIPPILIALLDDPWKGLAVLVLYFVIQQIESSFLTPYVMAQQVSLLPAITLLSQVVFATFFGFLGLLLALPLTVVGQIWLKEVLIQDVLDRWHHPKSKSQTATDDELAEKPDRAD